MSFGFAEMWNKEEIARIDSLAAKDKITQQYCLKLNELEEKYCEIINSLPENQRDIIERYIATCEEKDYRFAQLAFIVGTKSRR